MCVLIIVAKLPLISEGPSLPLKMPLRTLWPLISEGNAPHKPLKAPLKKENPEIFGLASLAQELYSQIKRHVGFLSAFSSCMPLEKIAICPSECPS